MKFLKYGFFAAIVLTCECCSSPDPASKQSTQSFTSNAPATEVTTVMAEVKPFEYFITASGKIASAAEVRMQFKRAGMIEKKYVINGQRVVKGQLLAVLANKEQELSLSKAKLALSEKQLVFTDQMLYVAGKDSIRQTKISDNIRITSGLAKSEIEYEEATFEYQNSFIRAQISGIVSGLELNTGNPVNENDLLCFIHDPLNLIVQADVLEADALQLAMGSLAEVRPTAAPGEIYPATVESINPRVDDKTGLVKVVLRLSKKANVFPGLHVQATMRLPFDKNIIVPKEAVIIRSSKTVVFTALNGLSKWNYVIVGRENGRDIEILEGLKNGDAVIVTNNLQLAHDAPITLKQ